MNSCSNSSKSVFILRRSESYKFHRLTKGSSTLVCCNCCSCQSHPNIVYGSQISMDPDLWIMGINGPVIADPWQSLLGTSWHHPPSGICNSFSSWPTDQLWKLVIQDSLLKQCLPVTLTCPQAYLDQDPSWTIVIDLTIPDLQSGPETSNTTPPWTPVSPQSLRYGPFHRQQLKPHYTFGQIWIIAWNWL